ncbi:MAG TPA: SDR family oxidoreductase [Gammaproteobacteria bacterium]|nr:SDR family oxidoreductase [Gammaproteobacteria bacterium]
MSNKLESMTFPNQIIKTVSLCLLALILFVSSFAVRADANQADGYIPTTLITGANRGIGFEFAKQYLAKGWRVIATCRKPEAADDLITLQAQYPELLIIDKLDVRDHTQIDLLAERYNNTRIDVLLNNAGISGGQIDQMFGRFNYETYNAVLETNTIGPLKMAEAFYPHVRDSRHKKIITVSSSEGSISNVFKRGGRLFFYRSSKSALNMVMVNLAYMLKDRGIVVAMVNPGATNTDFMASLAAMGFPLRKTEVAVSDMMRNIDALSIENTGAYLNYNGKTVPW